MSELQLNAPLLILTGEKYIRTDSCKIIRVVNSDHKLIVKVYKEVYHSFDREGKDEISGGHRLQYNAAAAADAIVQVRTFLAKNVK